MAGFESLNASTFLDTASHYYSVGPSISWLVFDANKVHFRIAAERARTDEAVAGYEKAVLEALQDVETALVDYARSESRRDELAKEVSADRNAVDLATQLYRQGIEDFLSVLDVERSLYVADDKLAQGDRDSALARVALYKALGGGWQLTSPRSAIPSD